MKRLEVILKVAERCNINCTYCYFFNGLDESYKDHSKAISEKTILATASFLKNTVISQDLQVLQIDFHGGEPMLIGKEKFDRYCNIFQNTLGGFVEVIFCMQTNAILIDPDWVCLFEKYDVKVATSLDGPKYINDVGRLDFRGKSTYQETVNGLKLLQQASVSNRISPVGVICVINPSFNASEIYDHFVNHLNLKVLEFLLPDETHDTFQLENAGKYFIFLQDLFDIWVEEDDPSIQIRILNSAISLLLGGKSLVVGFGTNLGSAITISSDGEIGPDDILRSMGTNICSSGFNVFNHSYDDFLTKYLQPINTEIHASVNEECRSCCWFKACGSTHPIHRFNKKEGFSRKSVYCEDMKLYFTNVSKYLLTKGLPFEKLKENLAID